MGDLKENWIWWLVAVVLPLFAGVQACYSLDDPDRERLEGAWDTAARECAEDREELNMCIWDSNRHVLDIIELQAEIGLYHSVALAMPSECRAEFYRLAEELLPRDGGAP